MYIFSQESSNLTSSELRNWSFSFYFAIAGGDGVTQGDIEDAMRAAEFDKRSPAFFWGSGVNHPFSSGRVSWMVGIKYYLQYPFSIGIFLSNTHLGETYGYHDQAKFINIDNSAFIIAPIISINSYDIIRIGIGPALYFTKAWEPIGASSKADHFKHTKIGFILDIGLRIPKETLLFGEINIQYRKVGTAVIGPFVAEYFDKIAVLPKTDVNYDHLFIGVGVGIRL
jgi:hypothetical protein